MQAGTYLEDKPILQSGMGSSILFRPDLRLHHNIDQECLELKLVKYILNWQEEGSIQPPVKP